MNINSPAITIAKTLLEINALDISQDEMLVTLGTIAEGDALAYTKNEAILFEYGILGRMIQVAFNTRGSENLASQSFATVSESYTTATSAYPQSILSALRGFTKIKLL
jgi:hypothetical protein